MPKIYQIGRKIIELSSKKQGGDFPFLLEIIVQNLVASKSSSFEHYYNKLKYVIAIRMRTTSG